MLCMRTKWTTLSLFCRFGPDGMIMSLSSFSSPQMTATFNGGIVKETTFRDVIQDSTARINNFKDKEWV